MCSFLDIVFQSLDSSDFEWFTLSHNELAKFKDNLLINGQLRIYCVVTEIVGVSPSVKLMKRIVEEHRATSFLTMLTDSKYHDVTFEVLGGKQFGVPFNLLASQSDVFDKMFSGEWKEAKEKCVKLYSIEPDVFSKFLRFLATGEMNIDEVHTLELLALAEMVMLSESCYFTKTCSYEQV